MSSVAANLPSIRSDEPLARYTSLKVGGAADLFAEAGDAGEAAALLAWAEAHSLPCRWIGGGSNLLIADAGLVGLAARFKAEALLLPDDPNGTVVSGAGHSFPNLARRLARGGWSGLEWAANVPGTVGGAVVNNAGAFGSCVAESLAWAEVVGADGIVRRLAVDDLEYAYRTSILKRGELGVVAVVRAAFEVQRTQPIRAVARVRELQARRTASQPRQLSAGSVFANPPSDYSGRLIEAAGLKGRRAGGAEISAQHANFIVNVSNATADEVYTLMRAAQQAVWQQFGTWLQPEIELVGRWTADQHAALREPDRVR